MISSTQNTAGATRTTKHGVVVFGGVGSFCIANPTVDRCLRNDKDQTRRIQPMSHGITQCVELAKGGHPPTGHNAGVFISPGECGARHSRPPGDFVPQNDAVFAPSVLSLWTTSFSKNTRRGCPRLPRRAVSLPEKCGRRTSRPALWW